MLRRREWMSAAGALLLAPALSVCRATDVGGDAGGRSRRLTAFRRSREGWTDTWLRALDELGPGDELALPAELMTVEAPLIIGIDRLRIVGQPGAILRAAPGTTFEYLLSADKRQGLVIGGLVIDANGDERRRDQRHRFMGLGLLDCVECRVADLAVSATLGFDGVPAAAIAVAGEGRGVRVSNVVLSACGTPEQPSDGLYMSGDDHLAQNVTARAVTDTALVLEACNRSRAHRIEVRDSAAAAAVTNITPVPKSGNAITGLIGRNLAAPVTGWVQIGCPVATAGDLVDTHVELDLRSNGGPGPGVNVRHLGPGRARGVTIAGTIVGAAAQGILIDGSEVAITADVKDVGGAAIQFQPGATGRVERSRLVGGTFGILVSDGATVSTAANSYDAQRFWNMYVHDGGSASSRGDSFGTAGIDHHGRDGGGTLLVR